MPDGPTLPVRRENCNGAFLICQGRARRSESWPGCAPTWSRTWDAEHGHLRELSEHDGALCLVVSEPEAGGRAAISTPLPALKP